VQALEGWRVRRLELAAGRALVLLQGTGRLRRAYVPRGPVPATPEAVDQLVRWARAEKLARLRIEPEAPSELAEPLRERDFVYVVSIGADRVAARAEAAVDGADVERQK